MLRPREGARALDSNQFQDLLRQRKDALLLPWTVMTGSIGIWAIVSSVITQEYLPAELPVFVAPLFWVLALVLAGASIALPRKALETPRIKAHMRSVPNLRQLATNLRTKDVDGGLLKQLSELSPSEQRLIGLTHVLLKPLALGLALSEAVAIVGFTFSIVARNFFAGFPMLILAFVLNGWHFPRVERLVELGRKEQPDEDLADFDKNLRDMERELKTRPRRASRPKS